MSGMATKTHKNMENCKETNQEKKRTGDSYFQALYIDVSNLLSWNK